MGDYIGKVVERERYSLRYIRYTREFSKFLSKARLFFLTLGFTLYVFEVH